MADGPTGPSYTPPEPRRRILRHRTVAPLLVAVGSAILIGGVVVLALTGPPTNRGLRITYVDGTERVICASLLRVSGDEPVDPGGVSEVAPQWIEAAQPSALPAPRPPAADGGRTDLVDADGDVVTGGGSWSAALLDPDPPEVPTARVVPDDDGC